MRTMYWLFALGIGLLPSPSTVLADELADLQAQQIETLQQAVQLIEAQYREGVANVHELIDAQARLLDAKLDAASAQKQRIDILKQQLDLSSAAEKTAKGQVQAGRAKRTDLLLAKAARLRVAIMLGKEKLSRVDDQRD